MYTILWLLYRNEAAITPSSKSSNYPILLHSQFHEKLGQNSDFHKIHNFVSYILEPVTASFVMNRSVPSPVPAVRDGSQHTQTGTLHLASSSSYERENVISGSQTGASSRVSEPSHFIPYVRTNEVYYLDPDAPLSRPSTQDLQYESAKSTYVLLTSYPREAERISQYIRKI